MSNVLAVFRITGLSPLLMHSPSAMNDKSAGGGGLNTKKIPTAEEEAARGVYRMPDGGPHPVGQLCIRGDAFRSSVLGKGGGASGRRVGKRTAIQCCSGGMFTTESWCPLIHPKTGEPINDYTINVMRVVIQGKDAVPRARPEIAEWACKLALDIDTDFVQVAMVLELLNISGKMAGVGDYRPQKRGPYGRFKAELVT